MKLTFDANLPYQFAAVSAATQLFSGQVPQPLCYDLTSYSGMSNRNRLLISPQQIFANVQAIQRAQNLPVDNTFQGLDFSVEMETGTGKTYVYLRTILELSLVYGFKHYIIVVPGIAIREGVLKTLAITQEHFKEIYRNLPYEYAIYNPASPQQIRNFVGATTVQILIITIDAFRSNLNSWNEDHRSNLIYKTSNYLNDSAPIELISATCPVVIIDEPQSVDTTDKSRQAIAALNPLCTLRYSATHKTLHHLIYQLGPCQAHAMQLVKQIAVTSVVAPTGESRGYLQLKEITYGSARHPIAKVRIQVKGKERIRQKIVSIKHGENLFTTSNFLPAYENGYQVLEINSEPDNSYVLLSNGQKITSGQEIGGHQADVWKAQIRRTVELHLDKELQVQGRGIKVLSLFFIDRVSNYRLYNRGGLPEKGVYATAFEEILAELLQTTRYQSLLNFPIEQMHGGYFAQDRKGAYRDSRGNETDRDIFSLIMRNKEQLLSLDEPLRFIFSHSALGEGWDNPNVFQICTLNETTSAIKKRQEIGRGLRLPVNQNGDRVFDTALNTLTIVANESYEEFARLLQTEYREDWGNDYACPALIPLIDRVDFPLCDSIAKLSTTDHQEDEFGKLWSSISNKITFSIDLNRQEFIKRCLAAIGEMDPIKPVHLEINEGKVVFLNSGTALSDVQLSTSATVSNRLIPSVINALQIQTGLTQDTICDVLTSSGRLAEFLANPDAFVHAVANILLQELQRPLLNGVRLEQQPSGKWLMIATDTNSVEPSTPISRKKLKATDTTIRTPEGFAIKTPLGVFHPNWARLNRDRSKISLFQ